MVFEGIEIYNYFVVFHGDVEEEYSPVIPLTEMNSSEYQRTAHLLMPGLADVLDSLEFILHLPRLSLDLYNQDELLLDSSYDTPHSIVLLPDSFLAQHTGMKLDATGIFVSDDCANEVVNVAEAMKTPLGVYRQSALKAYDINDIWQKLIEREGLAAEEIVLDIDKHYLLRGECLKALPVVFLARQYGCVDRVIGTIDASSPERVDDVIAEIYAKIKNHNNALVSLRNKGVDSLTEETYYIVDEEEERQKGIFRANVVMTLPGVAAAQRKIRTSSISIPEDELRMIRFLGIHRAIAKSAIYIELKQIDKEDFVEFNKLEIGSLNATKPKAKHIDKILTIIGEHLDRRLSEFQKSMLYRAISLTVFSDFPIGLAIAPHMTAPICLSVPTTYRPLTPLTRTLEYECRKIWQVDFSHKCNVLFLDCIKEDDLVKTFSNKTYEMMKKFSDPSSRFGSKRFSVDFKRIHNVDELMDVLKSPQMRDIDVLYISAHGFSERERNVSGVMIEDEPWIADGNDFKVPPFVVLSACSTSPRGTGNVNIADLLIRAGATAVLSTMVPVDAKANMVIMTRIFTYIVEAQKGSDQYNTLADAWSGVVATNAIHELRAASEGLNSWLYEDRDNLQPRIIDFQLNRCVGRLSAQNIYRDTIKLLKEMLHEENLDGKFDNVLSNKEYYPESYFYQMIGYPENIFLRNKIDYRNRFQAEMKITE
ncbi:CHAT domain-containing protein [Butyrivibrio sp. ob235]|uniref:CHAT domain-containing protein n=1 Tax=Butyrivibrio sp. ob235 TaxID=1761780 RepID=UPI0008AF5033|nr:CHAT domain-containing protein [Butyrivibrio sp. ob235]SEL98306.1 CHAT domain-containing protein [Butyrivibrio sp. ob235]